MSGRLGPSFTLISLMASSPLILTLVASCLVCLYQRERRPRSGWLLGGASLAYLMWATVGGRVFVSILQLTGLNFSTTEHGELMWAVKTISVTAIPATFQAVIWGCALWAVLIVNED